jgi:hypothetical protein
LVLAPYCGKGGSGNPNPGGPYPGGEDGSTTPAMDGSTPPNQDSGQNPPHQDTGTVNPDGGGTGGGGGGAGGGNRDGGANVDAGCDNCFETGTGTGEDEPFNLDDNENENVEVDDDGWLVVDTRPAGGTDLIWIVNTARATVSKIDTRNQIELGRYKVGAADPSRTSVAPNGDAYVGSRNGKGITKISALGPKCPDTNGDGVITTSTGPGDVLPWGEDDCALWFTPLDQTVRGVAVQYVAGQTVITENPNGPPDVTMTVPEEYVWAGGTDANLKLYKLDGQTGAIVIETTSPRRVYGLAMDGRDQVACGADQCQGPYLWMTSAWAGGTQGNGGLGHVDTSTCVDNTSCNAATVCNVTCTTTSCPDTCDDAVKAHYTLEGTKSSYGITVDCKQRIWLADYASHGVRRYDPFEPVNQRLSEAATATNGVHGIAADADGWVWGAKAPNVVRLDAETLAHASISTGGSKGVAVDAQGMVWVIPISTSAHRIDPGAGLNDATVSSSVVTGLNSPYTYSDMTGQQLVLASNDPGYYRALFEGCKKVDGEEVETEWGDFTFKVDTPSDTRIIFIVRSAKTIAKLDSAKWYLLADIPGDTSPVDLGQMLGNDAKKYVEVEVKLFAYQKPPSGVRGCGTSETESPRVKKFGVSYRCPRDPVVVIPE